MNADGWPVEAIRMTRKARRPRGPRPERGDFSAYAAARFLNKRDRDVVDLLRAQIIPNRRDAQGHYHVRREALEEYQRQLEGAYLESQEIAAVAR